MTFTPWYEYPSNFSGGQLVDGIGSFFQYSNYAVGGWLGVFILFLTFSISYVILSKANSEKAIATSLFGTAFIATLLMRMEMIAVPLVVMLWVGALIGMILVRNSANKGL